MRQTAYHNIDEAHAELDGEAAAPEADTGPSLAEHRVVAHLQQPLPAGRVHIDAGLVTCVVTVCIQTIKSTGSLKT